MAYDPNLTSVRDRMRFDLGDTADPPMLPEATYNALITQYAADARLATIAAADALINRYSQEATQWSEGTVRSATFGNRIAGWQALVTRLRAEIAGEATATTRPSAFSGSVSVRGTW